jgi:hypothetical protein
MIHHKKAGSPLSDPAIAKNSNMLTSGNFTLKRSLEI